MEQLQQRYHRDSMLQDTVVITPDILTQLSRLMMDAVRSPITERPRAIAVDLAQVDIISTPVALELKRAADEYIGRGIQVRIVNASPQVKAVLHINRALWTLCPQVRGRKHKRPTRTPRRTHGAWLERVVEVWRVVRSASIGKSSNTSLRQSETD